LATAWYPSVAGGVVRDVEAWGSTVYLGGAFQQVGGQLRRSLAAIEGGVLLEVADERRGESLTLGPLRPNPVRGSGVVAFELARAGQVTLEIVDLAGRRVRRVLEGAELATGRHEVRIGRAGLAPGMYFLRLSALGLERTARMIVIE
jgi:hypothetical protein